MRKERAVAGPPPSGLENSLFERIAPAFLEEERRQMGDWWFGQEYPCEFVATTDQVFAYDLVIRALSDEVAPLFPGAGASVTVDATAPDADVERPFKVKI